MFIAVALLAGASTGCTDPEPVALAACQAVPGLSVDAAGLALLTPLLTDDELAVLRGGEQTRGHARLGDDAWAQIRAGAACEIASVESAGSGRWAVAMRRTAPAVTPAGAIGDAAAVELAWQVVDVDGGRAEVGLVKAAARWKSAKEAAQKGNLKLAASSLRALANSFPDPMLAVDVAEMEAAEEMAAYQKKLSHTFGAAGAGEVTATFTNGGDRPLSEVVAVGFFESAGGPLRSEATMTDVPAGATVEYTLPIPDGADGSVKLKTAKWSF